MMLSEQYHGLISYWVRPVYFFSAQKSSKKSMSMVATCWRPSSGAGVVIFDSIYSTFSEIEKSCNTGILKNGRAHLLCDEGRGGAGLVLPVGREDALGLVVAGQAVDPGLDENEPELGVLVLAVALQVLADAHGLLDLEIWRWNSNIKQLRVKGEQRLIEGLMLNKKP